MSAAHTQEDPRRGEDLPVFSLRKERAVNAGGTDGGEEEEGEGRALPYGPKTYRQALVLMTALLISPAFLNFDEQPGKGVGLCGFRLPPLCMTQELVGVDCPGCGLTRAFVLIAHGRLRKSLEYHRLGIMLYAYFLFLAAFNASALLAPRHPFTYRLHIVQLRLPWLILALLVLNWIPGR
jgi:hypothetical protein